MPAMQTTGIKELLAKYERMGRAAIPIGKAAVRAGGEVVRAAYIRNAPVRSGMTVKAIRLSVRASNRTGVIATVGFNPKVFTKTKRKIHRGNPFAAALSESDPFYVPWTNEGHFTGKRLKQFKVPKGSDRRQLYRSASQLAGRKFVQGTHWIDNARAAAASPARAAINAVLRQKIRQADASGGVVTE